MRAGTAELSVDGDTAEAGRSGSNDENRDPALIDQDKHGYAHFIHHSDICRRSLPCCLTWSLGLHACKHRHIDLLERTGPSVL